MNNRNYNNNWNRNQNPNRNPNQNIHQNRNQQPQNRPVRENDEFKFLNPYNFVRYLETNSSESNVLLRTFPPDHDEFTGISGKIECTYKTESPLFIAGKEVSAVNDHKTLDFFKINGKPVIPGSSLRGIVRSVFEAATNSCFGFLEDRRLSYRYDPNEARHFVPARVVPEQVTGKLCLQLLPGENIQGFNPRTLKAAWIRQYRNNPVNLGKLKHGNKCWGIINDEPVTHHSHRFSYWEVIAVQPFKDNTKESLEKNYPGKRVYEGWLFITNKNINNKHDERFFFKGSNAGNFPVYLRLSDTIIENYNALIEDYNDRHIETLKKRVNPYIVENGEMALSRFIKLEPEKLSVGDLVYAKLSNDNTKVEYIAPLAIPRISHPHSIENLLDDNIKSCDLKNTNVLNIKDLKLCPACRVFGWVNGEPNNTKNTINAYKSRVAFSDGKFTKEKPEVEEKITLSILSAPKPTTTAFYLLNSSGQPQYGLKYEKLKAKLRGRKFYLKPVDLNSAEYKRVNNIANNQNKTIQNVVKADNEFTFTVSFNNLHQVELGALLWSLQLERGWLHQLGMAKPYGFGQTSVQKVKLETINIEHRYTSLSNSGYTECNETKIYDYILAFKNAMKSVYGKEFDKLENIVDMKALMTIINKKIHYPRPPFIINANKTDNSNPEGKQYEWFLGYNKLKGKNLEFPLPGDCINKLFPLIDRDGYKS